MKKITRVVSKELRDFWERRYYFKHKFLKLLFLSYPKFQKNSMLSQSGGICDFQKKVLSSTKEWASWVAQLVKNLPAMQETLVQSLGGKVPFEKG